MVDFFRKDVVERSEPFPGGFELHGRHYSILMPDGEVLASLTAWIERGGKRLMHVDIDFAYSSDEFCFDDVWDAIAAQAMVQFKAGGLHRV